MAKDEKIGKTRKIKTIDKVVAKAEKNKMRGKSKPVYTGKKTSKSTAEVVLTAYIWYHIYMKSGNKITIQLSNLDNDFLQSYKEYLETGGPNHIAKYEHRDGGEIVILWSEVESVHAVWSSLD